MIYCHWEMKFREFFPESGIPFSQRINFNAFTEKTFAISHRRKKMLPEWRNHWKFRFKFYLNALRSAGKLFEKAFKKNECDFRGK